jgi:hypothetical protein
MSATDPLTPREQSDLDRERLLWRQRYTLALDVAITRALLELELLPGNVAGKGAEASSRNVERQIPVNSFGRARGDVTLADLKARAAKAKTITAKSAVLQAIREEVDAIRLPRRVGWADRATLDGRLMIARHARDHGRAAAAYAYDVSTRTVTKYLAELKAQEDRAR